MPADPAGRGADQLTHVDRFQLLSCAFEIRTNALPLFERLAYIVQRADQSAIAVTARSTIEVLSTGEGYRIRDEEGEDVELSLVAAVEAIFQRLHRRALASVPDHIAIHAASLMHEGRLVLLTGPKRAGKTTLALRLLFEGWEVAGDELVLLQGGWAMAFPRRFYVRDTSLSLLPQLQAVAGRPPFVASPTEGTLIAVDPTRFGRPWRIAPAPVSAILHLEPNHGGRTVARACGKVEMARRVMSECTPPASRRPDWIGDLCRTVDGATTAILQVGELDSAALVIRSILAQSVNVVTGDQP
jgi:hypothetical protein